MKSTGRRLTPAATLHTPPRDFHFRYALIGIGLTTFIRLLWLAGHPIDLYPDEAQYWIWAQHPAWGYYSKPPMVAWIIAATTKLFGEDDLAVKAGAPLIYVFTSLVVYALARRLYDARIAAWSAIAFVTLPAVSISAVIISTDVPLLFFWALGIYGFVRARDAGQERWWALVGIAIGLGLLSKFAMGFWVLSAFAFLLTVKDERRHLRYFLSAVLLGLVLYSPNLIWNWQHGFASYAHTQANANLTGFAFHPLEFAEFVGSQFGVFGPIYLATLIFIAVQGKRAIADRRTLLLLMFALPTLLIMMIEAGLSRAQPNWSAPTYISATILVVAYLTEKRRDGLVQWSVLLHVGIVVLAFGASDLAKIVHQSLPGRYDPLHRLRGWQRLGRAVGQVRLQNGLPQVLFDERETMADLTYYMNPPPFDAKIWHSSPRINNGFELESPLPATPGGDYLWITMREDKTEILGDFEHSEMASHISVAIGRGLMREVWVYRLQGFKGYVTPPQ